MNWIYRPVRGPTSIESHPNISNDRLVILYEGRPTTTIAVGDPLTFKLESLQGYNLISDIFATNMIAKDPYTGKRGEIKFVNQNNIRYKCKV